MGLDMYALAVDERLVKKEEKIEVDLWQIARLAVGFKDVAKSSLKTFSEEAKAEYFKKAHEANMRAEAEGIIAGNFFYWRKFNALHGYMEKLYISKGGRGEFNCVTMRLDPEDLDELLAVAKNGALRPCEGFFFGAQVVDEQDLESITKFVADSKEAIANGKAVFYYSWW